MHNISWFLTLHETYNSGHRQGSIGYVIFLHITESVGSTHLESVVLRVCSNLT